MLERFFSSSFLILAVILVRAAFRGRISARMQYSLWLLVLLRLLVPFSLYPIPAAMTDAAAPTITRIETISETEIIGDPRPETETITAPSDTVSSPRLTVGDVSRRIWFGGMAVVSAWFIIVNVRLQRKLRRDRRRYDYDCRIPIYVAADIPSPCLVGLFSPAVYLTEHASEDPAQAHQIITHELTHLRHLDLIWALLRCVCLTVWWFDPLVWAAASLIRRDCELACDEGTILALGEGARFDYGRTLVDMAKVGVRPSDLLCGATTMTSGSRALKERVERIAAAKKPSEAAAFLALFIVFTAAGCAFSGTSAKPGALDPSEDDAVKRYYSLLAQTDTTQDYSHMDLSQLDAMRSPSVGTSVETDELKVEVAGAAICGNTAEVILRVTAKQLDSLLLETEGTPEHLHNYRFNDETSRLIYQINFDQYTGNGFNIYSLPFWDIFCDDDDSLAENQYEIRYCLVTRDPFHEKQYSFVLSDFGYYDFKSPTQFTTLYPGNIQIDVSFESGSGAYIRSDINNDIMLGDIPFIVKDVQLTPLACTFHLVCSKDSAFIDLNYQDIYKTLIDKSEEFSVKLSDGTVINGDPANVTVTGRYEYYIYLSFPGPVDTKDIVSVSLFSDEYFLQ